MIERIQEKKRAEEAKGIKKRRTGGRLKKVEKGKEE